MKHVWITFRKHRTFFVLAEILSLQTAWRQSTPPPDVETFKVSLLIHYIFGMCLGLFNAILNQQRQAWRSDIDFVNWNSIFMPFHQKKLFALRRDNIAPRETLIGVIAIYR